MFDPEVDKPEHNQIMSARYSYDSALEAILVELSSAGALHSVVSFAE